MEHKEHKIPTGIRELDALLQGGYEKEVITAIYGPPASGKTNICMLAIRPLLAQGKKVVYIDTEGSFSVERYAQIDPDYKESIKNILFFKPTLFEEQNKCLESLKKKLPDGTALVVVDSVVMLYRLELGKSQDTYNTNRELGVQLSYLTDIARKNDIPVLATSQVYSKMEENDSVNIVGGDILRYSSKCLIELQKFHDSRRVLTLRKHRSIKGGAKLIFEITQEGIHIIG